MRLNFYRIREWFLRTLSHKEYDMTQEAEPDIQNETIPITGDEPLSGLDNTEQTKAKEDSTETKTDKPVIPLSEEINVEGSNSIVFDNVEPVSPLDITPSSEDADNEAGTEEQKTDEAFSESKMVSLTVDSIKYYDKLRSQMPTDDLRTVLDDVCRNMVENLIMAGCQSINEEPGVFDMSRHRTEPFQLVEEGTPYTKVLRKGVEYKNEVKLLAIVEL